MHNNNLNRVNDDHIPRTARVPTYLPTIVIITDGI